MQDSGVHDQTQSLAAMRCRNGFRKGVSDSIHADLFQQPVILRNRLKNLLGQVKVQLCCILHRLHHLDRVFSENLRGWSCGSNEFFLDVLTSVVWIDKAIRIVRDRVHGKGPARHVVFYFITEQHQAS